MSEFSRGQQITAGVLLASGLVLSACTGGSSNESKSSKTHASATHTTAPAKLTPM